MARYTGRCWHGTTTLRPLSAGATLDGRRAEYSVNAGSWAALTWEDAAEYARAAAMAYGGEPVVWQCRAEDCRQGHDGTCLAVTDEWGGSITVEKKSRRKIAEID